MPRRLLALLVLLVAGCAAGPGPGAAPGAPVRLLITGRMDLSGPAAAVARTDPEGLLREIRLLARRADLAIVGSAPEGADALLAAAGFDLVACPHRRILSSPVPAAGMPGLQVSCPAATGAATSAIVGTPATLAADDLLAPAQPGGVTTLGLVTLTPRGARLAVSGLGPLLGASGDDPREGAILEVLAGRAGVIAYRVGRVTHADLRVHFAGWDLPRGNAVLLDGEWWELAEAAAPADPLPLPSLAGFGFGEVTAAAAGDVTADGIPDLAVSYRHPFRPTALSEAWPAAVGVDAFGRSAHLGVFTLEGEALWAAGRIPRPVGALAACDGAVALAYTARDDPTIAATGAAVWRSFSLRAAPELPGPGTPHCADVDRDGSLDPIILGRSR